YTMLDEKVIREILDKFKLSGKKMTLAIIPARAGSKGIKNKNLALLHDRPLLYYTINAAKNSKYVDKIVLSSDGDDILEYGQTQGVDVLKRPKELALDDTTSDKVVLHTLSFYKDYNEAIMVRNFFSYQLGELILKTSRKWNVLAIVILPYKIAQLYRKKFKKG
ncbi:hypothetical protein ACLZ7R_001772, partial [Campylobacter jejuni]